MSQYPPWPKELASWIVHVRRLAPEMPFDKVWEFAAHYRTAKAMGEAEDRWVRQLDAYMALELFAYAETTMTKQTSLVSSTLRRLAG